jgi:hypothetical protein
MNRTDRTDRIVAGVAGGDKRECAASFRRSEQ